MQNYSYWNSKAQGPFQTAFLYLLSPIYILSDLVALYHLSCKTTTLFQVAVGVMFLTVLNEATLFPKNT